MSDTHKRKRSPEPEETGELDPEPMAPGVKFGGFLWQSDRILRKSKDDKKKRNTEISYVLESAGEHILENSGGMHREPFKFTVQWVHMLLEAAVSATNAVALEGEEAEKIAKLDKYLKEGLDLIDGEWIEGDYTSDEGEK
jgi:hypothetical protein